MSCNTFIPIMDLVREVEALLAANYIDKDDPRITGGVFTNPTIKEGFLLDVQAREEFCRLVQECGLDAPFGKMWLSRPLYPDQMFVSYEDSGEPQTKWKTIQAVLESAGVFGPAATSLSSRLAEEITRSTAADTLHADKIETNRVNIAANTQTGANNKAQVDGRIDALTAAGDVRYEALTQVDATLQSQLDSLGGGSSYAYATYAAMVADKDNIPANSSVDVTADTTSSNNGKYSYDGTTFTKSLYDPAQVAKTYTDAQFVADRKKSRGVYPTLSALQATLLEDNSYALVADDPIPTNNGYYRKVGGVWVRVKYDPSAIAEEKIRRSLDMFKLVEYTSVLSAHPPTTGTYIDNTGVLVAAPSRAITPPIPVQEGMFVKYSAYLATNMSSISAYNADGVFVASLLTGAVTGAKTGYVTIPAGVATIRVSVATAQANTFELSTTSAGVVDKMLSLGVVGYVDLLKTDPPVVGGYIDMLGEYVPRSTWSVTDMIPVRPGDKIAYSAYLTSSASAIAAYDGDYEFMGTILGGGAASPVGADAEGSVTIGAGVEYIRISVANAYTNSYLTLRPTSASNSGAVSASRYQGKTWTSMGTSIVDSTATPTTYQKWVKEYFGFTLHNHASSGSRLRQSIIARAVADIDAHLLASDIITIDHGTNDFKLETPMGALSDLPTSAADLKNPEYASRDGATGTFFADLKGVIEYIYTANPGARIMLVTPIRRTQPASTGTDTNSLGHKLNDYRNAILETAEFYSLPVLDNFKNSGFNPKTLPIWTADGLHPTPWAQENVLANKMIGFIEAN